MISSFGVSLALLVLAKNGVTLSTHVALMITIAVTSVLWVATAYLGPQTDRATLIAFYRKVRPFGPGWEPIRRAAGIAPGAVKGQQNIPLALLGWVAGSTAIWSALFTVGNFLYGRMGMALALFSVFAVSSLALLNVVHRLWSADPVDEPGA